MIFDKRTLRENKYNRVCHLISRIAHRAFYLDVGVISPGALVSPLKESKKGQCNV